MNNIFNHLISTFLAILWDVNCANFLMMKDKKLIFDISNVSRHAPNNIN